MATCNYFEASHGKGAPDGVRGALQRAADRLIKQGEDLPDPKSVYLNLKDKTTMHIPVDRFINDMSSLRSRPCGLRRRH